MTSARTRARGALGLAIAGVLVLTGCSGGSDEPEAAGASSSSSAPAEPEPYLPVPDGVELTPPGTRLDVGERAVVAYEPRQDLVGVLDIKVRRLEKTSFRQSFAGWKIDADTSRTNPYFVRARVTNLGDTDLGGRPVPLYIVDGKNTLIKASTFKSTFKPCPVGEFPKRFRKGDVVNACLVYLSPARGELTAVSFRPTQDFSPITWTGDLVQPRSVEKAQAGKGKKGTDKKGARRKR